MCTLLSDVFSVIIPYLKVKDLEWLPHPLSSCQCRIILTSSCSDATHASLSRRTDVLTKAVPLLAQKSVRSNSTLCERIKDAYSNTIVSMLIKPLGTQMSQRHQIPKMNMEVHSY